MSYCITNPKDGYCYVNVAKAGCTSIKVAIASHLGVPFDAVQWRYPYRQRIEYAVAARDLFRFSVVRHPAARLVSCWADWCCEPYPNADNYKHNHEFLALKGMPFPEFLKYIIARPPAFWNHHYSPQWWEVFYQGEPVTDSVFRLETLADEWPALQQRFGLPALEHHRRSDHRPWPEYYDAGMRARVVNFYREDFRRFDYGWDE